MRVTANTFPNSLVDQLSRLASRQYRLQNQAATGQRIALPEDDPTAMRRVMDMQGEARAISQYLGNIARHQELATVSYGAMKSLKQVGDRAGEIAVLADELKSPEELTIYATEINELIKQAVQFANQQNRGDYIFSGTRTDQPPFVATFDVNGQVTAVTYQGNTELAESEIAEAITITAQSLGANTSGTGSRGLLVDSRVGADFFNHLISLRDNLTSGNTAAIAATNQAELRADEDNFIYHFGVNGAVQSRLETTAAVSTRRGESLEKLVSREADADLATTLVRFNQMQTAYQAALQSGGSVLSSSLLDFLR